MPALGYEDCGNATLTAARVVNSPLGKGATSASWPTLDLSTATFLELQFAEFGKCAPWLRPCLASADEQHGMLAPRQPSEISTVHITAAWPGW